MFGVFPYWLVDNGLLALLVAVPTGLVLAFLPRARGKWRESSWITIATALVVAMGALFVVAFAASEDDYTRDGTLRWERRGGLDYLTVILGLSTLLCVALLLLPHVRTRFRFRVARGLYAVAAVMFFLDVAGIAAFSIGN